MSETISQNVTKEMSAVPRLSKTLVLGITALGAGALYMVTQHGWKKTPAATNGEVEKKNGNGFQSVQSVQAGVIGHERYMPGAIRSPYVDSMLLR